VALEVNRDDRVPLCLRHVHEHAVAQDAGVVDQDVEVAERLHGHVDHALGALPVGDVVVVRDRLAAHGLDLVHDLLCRRGVVARAVVGAAEVVHHDLCALRGEEQRVLAADAAPCAGDDRDASLQFSHGLPLCRDDCRGETRGR